ncbi:MAG: DEAD/DEAH box helicase [Cytophagaceae bacterium]
MSEEPIENVWGKLNKQALRALTEAGITEPKEVQEKTLSRISGGQDLIVVAPEGSGKTTAMILGVIMRLKYHEDAPPRAVVLTSHRDSAIALEERFISLAQYTGLKIVTLLSGHSLEGQKDALAEGADIVIGTPDRVQAVYYKSGLNVNKLKMFILDDADLMIKEGFQTVIRTFTESLPKCQHLVYTEVLHNKLETLLDDLMHNPTIVEVNEFTGEPLDTIPLSLYTVPNYKTKLNLVNLLLRDQEEFPKVLVFVNTKITCESIHKSLSKRNPGEVAMLNPTDFEIPGVASLKEFLHSDELRILVCRNDEAEPLKEVEEVPCIVHFDVPEDPELFIGRVSLKEDEETDIRGLVFSTELELTQLKKIEKALGFYIQAEELPMGLIIEGDRKSHKDDEKEEIKGGGAFHEKKPENAKDYNLKYKDRLKMFGKKNRRNKKGN